MRFTEPTPAQEKGWREWVAARPPHVRVVAERFEPWSVYRLKTTGQIVTIAGFDENAELEVTVRVNVSGDFNLVLHERRVFGISPDDLEPCDLPAASAPTGSLLTEQDVEDNIHVLRVMRRPDLWVLDGRGIAVRKH